MNHQTNIKALNDVQRKEFIIALNTLGLRDKVQWNIENGWPVGDQHFMLCQFFMKGWSLGKKEKCGTEAEPKDDCHNHNWHGNNHDAIRKWQ